MSKTVLAQVEGWTPIIDSIVQEHGIITAAVFGRVWRYCQMENGVCTASQETIATDLGLSRPTVNQHIDVLVGSGYLKDEDEGVKNRPHTYSDTGKAGLEVTITVKKGVKQIDTGVKEIDTKQAKNDVGVKQIDSGVKQIDSGCKEDLHLGVKQIDMKILSLRNSLRKYLRESNGVDEISHSYLWQMVLDQLKGEINPINYGNYVSTLVSIGYIGDSLAIETDSPFVLDWCRSNLGKKISRLAAACANQEIEVVFLLKQAVL